MHHYFSFPILLILFFATLQLGCSGRGYEETVNDLEGKTVIQIDLSNTAVTDADLLAMEFPDALQTISLENTAITDAGVESLLGAENLEQVNLGNTEITPASMKILEQLPKLQTVNIAGKNITPSVAFDFFKKIASKNSRNSLGNKASIKFFIPSNDKQNATPK